MSIIDIVMRKEAYMLTVNWELNTFKPDSFNINFVHYVCNAILHEQRKHKDCLTVFNYV